VAEGGFSLDDIDDNEVTQPSNNFVKSSVSIRTSEKYNIGARIKFGLSRFNVYDSNGNLIETIKN
jgi:hypothetical protein